MTHLILGAGGHARVLLDTLQQSGIVVKAFVDREDSPLIATVSESIPVWSESRLANFSLDEVVLYNGLGSVRDTRLRRDLYLHHRTWQFGTVCHPSATVSPRAHLGMGVQILAGAIVQTGATVGANTICNSGSIIDHDCQIGAHVHLAPGVRLSGSVWVGEGSHIGTGAIVIQGIHIGTNCLVAAGSVVVKDISDDSRVRGVPARSF